MYVRLLNSVVFRIFLKTGNIKRNWLHKLQSKLLHWTVTEKSQGVPFKSGLCELVQDSVFTTACSGRDRGAGIQWSAVQPWHRRWESPRVDLEPSSGASTRKEQGAELAFFTLYKKKAEKQKLNLLVSAQNISRRTYSGWDTGMRGDFHQMPFWTFEVCFQWTYYTQKLMN